MIPNDINKSIILYDVNSPMIPNGILNLIIPYGIIQNDYDYTQRYKNAFKHNNIYMCIYIVPNGTTYLNMSCLFSTQRYYAQKRKFSTQRYNAQKCKFSTQRYNAQKRRDLHGVLGVKPLKT